MQMHSDRYRGDTDDDVTDDDYDTGEYDGEDDVADDDEAADETAVAYGPADGDDAADWYGPADGYATADGYVTAADYDTTDDYGDPSEFAEQRNANAYWRRRFLILAGGITALGLCVWLLPGGHPTPASTAAGAQASRAALAAGAPLPSAAVGSSYPGSTTQWPSAASPTATPAPSASHPAAAKLAQSAKHHKTRHQKAQHQKAKKPTTGYQPPATAASSGRCQPASIVLSLFTSQASYPAGALPAFSVYAVSTAAAPCTLSYGPGTVHLAVTSHGHVVWDSAACKLTAVRRVKFTRGVPQVLTMTWNRQSTGPAGCAGSLAAGASGTFDAVAVTDGQSSPVHSFKLAKPKKTHKPKPTRKPPKSKKPANAKR